VAIGLPSRTISSESAASAAAFRAAFSARTWANNFARRSGDAVKASSPYDVSTEIEASTETATTAMRVNLPIMSLPIFFEGFGLILQIEVPVYRVYKRCGEHFELTW
jgi:hypothetical protein